MSKFKELHALEDRKTQSKKILADTLNRVPVILEKARKSAMQDLPHSKFLCPPKYSVDKLVLRLKRKLGLPKGLQLFLFASTSELLPGPEIIGRVYDSCKEEDNFLYITYSDRDDN